MSGYREGPDSTFTSNGRTWPLDPFLKRSESLPIVPVPVKDLQWVLDHSHPDPHRVRAADVRVPILYTRDPKWGLVAIDGLHRLQKAVQQRLKFLPGREIPPEWFDEFPQVSLESAAGRYTVCKITPEQAQNCLLTWDWAIPPTGHPQLYNTQQQALRLYYAALDGDQIVGVCILMNHSRYSPGVFVDPRYGRQGIGRLLLDDLKVDCITVPTNAKAARGFVEHLGFHTEGGTDQYQVYVRHLGLYMMAM